MTATRKMTATGFSDVRRILPPLTKNEYIDPKKNRRRQGVMVVIRRYQHQTQGLNFSGMQHLESPPTSSVQDNIQVIGV